MAQFLTVILKLTQEISDTLWFVLYFDKKIPNKIDKNIILIKLI